MNIKSRVEQILRDEIAPALELDVGGVEVVDVSDGIAQMRFTDACASCPSTIMVLMMGIEQELRSRVPEVEFVEVVP